MPAEVEVAPFGEAGLLSDTENMALHHSLPLLELRAQAEGLIEGYASVFGGVDSYGDTIAPGAYAQSLADHQAKGTAPVMLWSHNPDTPVGKWTALREDARGLAVRGQLNLRTDAGKQAFEHLQAGDLNGLSIGFRVPAGGARYEDGARLLTRIDLAEVSIVSMPADASARVLSVKTTPQRPTTLREHEDALVRLLGYSRREAKALAAKGYAGLSTTTTTHELAEAIKAAARSIAKD